MWRYLALLLVGACASAPAFLPGEDLPGGSATNRLLLGQNSFVQPLSTLSAEERGQFFSGNAFFNQAWVVAPSSTTARDGLGPLFNATGCSGCHFRDGRNAPPDEGGSLGTVLVRISVGQDADGAPQAHAIYGGQLQPLAIDGVPAEVVATVRWQEVQGSYVDGTSYTLRKPIYEYSNWGYGDPGQMRLSPRIAPQMIGLGLLGAIADADVMANVASVDDGVSGEVQRVRVGDEWRIGRFGWKAEQPTVRHQVAGALLGDLGVTSPLHTENPCSETQRECRASANGGEPEADEAMLDRLAWYSSTLAPPVRPHAVENVEGRALFEDIGCASCHRPSYVTSAGASPAMRSLTIWPYTDLLLHDMGPELADEHAVFAASGSEWKTTPLWGTGRIDDVNGHSAMLHDGRARGFAEAILWHGGEAEVSRERFRALSQTERETLLRFLGSL